LETKNSYKYSQNDVLAKSKLFNIGDENGNTQLSIHQNKTFHHYSPILKGQ
jgi:hypothetical protein